MTDSAFNRRDFNKLTAAAFGGMVAGTMVGCGNKEQSGGGATTTGTPGGEVAAKEVHLCRGLNSCKGQGGSGQNDCAGAGTCATVAHHTCGGENTCKGLGGCGANAGENLCKGNGGCQVPLMEDPWSKLRKKLETKLTAEGKNILEAPPKPAG